VTTPAASDTDHCGQAVSQWSSLRLVGAAVTLQSQAREVFEYEIVFLVGVVSLVAVTTHQQIPPAAAS